VKEKRKEILRVGERDYEIEKKSNDFQYGKKQVLVKGTEGRTYGI
jgi:hypothetical protein